MKIFVCGSPNIISHRYKQLTKDDWNRTVSLLNPRHPPACSTNTGKAWFQAPSLTSVAGDSFVWGGGGGGGGGPGNEKLQHSCCPSSAPVPAHTHSQTLSKRAPRQRTFNWLFSLVSLSTLSCRVLTLDSICALSISL